MFHSYKAMATNNEVSSDPDMVKDELLCDDESLMKFCSCCLEADQSKIDAVKFCSTCGDTLCTRCDALHKRNKHTKDHPVISIAETTLQQFRASRVVIDDHCQSHVDKPTDMLCIDHQKLCCPICQSTTHKSCDNFMTLEQAATIFSLKDKKETDGNNMKDLIKKIKKLQNQEKGTSTALTNSTADVRKDIKTFAKALKQKIDTLEHQAETELNQHSDAQNDQIQQNNLAVAKLKEVLGNESRIYELLPHLTPRQVFLSTKQMLDRITQSHHSSKNRLKAVDILFNFQEANIASNFLGSLTSFGDICKSSPGNIPDLSSVEEYLTTQELALEIQQPAYAQVDLTSQKTTSSNPKKQINLLICELKLTKTVRIDDLKKGNLWFTGGTYISNGQLVLPDFNNKRLMVFDDNYKCVDEYTCLGGSPSDVCSVQQGSDDVLYVSTYTNTVQVITYNKQGWTPTRTITTETNLYGVACVGDTLITGQADKVVLHSLTDETKKKEWRKGGLDSYIAVSPQGDRFYHNENNTVVCRGLDGTVHWKYGHEKLNYPIGICTDHQGNLYVVGNSSCNIHQISADGSTHRIRVDPVQNIVPWGIVFHPHKNKFIVTSCGYNKPLQEYTFS